MNVTLADILAAYILTFGQPMDSNKPFAKGAEEIRTARKDWRYVFGAVAAAGATMRAQGIEYPDYSAVAVAANELIADFAKNAKAAKA
jgi:hypothetical protein